MAEIAPTITYRSIFEFINGATIVEVAPPIVNDVKSQQLTRINRQTRGLTRKMYIDADWHQIQTFDYTFKNLTLAKKDALVSLLTSAVGKAISIIDHLNKDRTVYIVEVGPIIENRNDECSYEINVILQEVT